MVPHGNHEIQAGDLVYFAMDPAELENVLALLRLRRGAERRVMIAGATRIGIDLARRLETMDVPVTVVEPKRDAAESAAAQLADALVVHGSATDRALLEEEGAERAQGFVACADDHEENVVACLLARQLGAAHTFALVDNPALAGLIGELGIDAVISPRQLSVSLALHFARRGRVKAVAALLEDSVEVVEAEAVAGSRLVRDTLAEVKLPRGTLVAAVARGERIVVPRGDDRVEPGDRVLIIMSSDNPGRLDAFLEERT